MNVRFFAAATLVAAGFSSAVSAGVVVSSTRAADGAFDRVELRLTQFDGVHAPYNVLNGGITSVTGTLSVDGAGSLSLPGSDSTWFLNLTSASAGISGQTYFNFERVNNLVPQFYTRTPAGGPYTSLFGNPWFSTTSSRRLKPSDIPTGDGFDQTLLGVIYVAPGTGFSFDGLFNISAPGRTTLTSQPFSFEVAATVVPEPSAALAGMAVAAVLLGRRRH